MSRQNYPHDEHDDESTPSNYGLTTFPICISFHALFASFLGIVNVFIISSITVPFNFLWNQSVFNNESRYLYSNDAILHY